MVNGWILVEKVSPSDVRNKFKGRWYPRSEAIATREEAEALKTSVRPEHGGEIIIITVAEFYLPKKTEAERGERLSARGLEAEASPLRTEDSTGLRRTQGLLRTGLMR